MAQLLKALCNMSIAACRQKKPFFAHFALLHADSLTHTRSAGLFDAARIGVGGQTSKSAKRVQMRYQPVSQLEALFQKAVADRTLAHPDKCTLSQSQLPSMCRMMYSVQRLTGPCKTLRRVSAHRHWAQASLSKCQSRTVR